MTRRDVSVILMCLTACLNYGNCATIDDMVSLRSVLFQNYTSEFRPLYNQSDAVVVKLKFMLEGITSLNEVKQELGCNAVLHLKWKDDFLHWKPEKYGDVDSIHPLINQIWHPKLMVTNSIGSRELVSGENHPISVNHDGQVTWFPATVLQTSCGLDMTWFPFDKQTCEIRIQSIQYDASKLLLTTDLTEIELTRSYRVNGIWDYVDSGFSVKEDSSIITVHLTLQRQPLFLVLNIITPIVVISFLNMAVFAVPSDSGEKLSAAITVFLSLSVFMTYVSDKMPQTSTPLSVLTIYLTFILLTSALTVLFTIWILNIHYKSQLLIPTWLNWVAMLNLNKKRASKVAGSFEQATGTESHPVEYQVTWLDVSNGLDYIFLRVFISIITITTVAFIAKLIVSNN